MGKYCNWQQEDKEILKELFEQSITQCGQVKIYTVLNHVSSSGMTRYISAYVPVIRKNYAGVEEAQIVCIAREKKVSGCGMDMGFHLAYCLYHSVYEYGEKGGRPYQKYLNHSWL